jgi:hypothetical protein
MQKGFFRCAGVTALWIAGAASVQAQLAITEVHSAASTNGTVAIHADWWELTNFGNQPVDLSGYRFNDATGGLATGAVVLPSLTLIPGESIVFVESISSDAFREWWWAGLPGSVQVFSYATNSIGLSSSGDSVRLWDADATEDADVVDSVDIGAAGGSGATFVYDPSTGAMSRRPALGEVGVFAAADNGDLGSPGSGGAMAAVDIMTQPADQTVNPGDAAVFTVGAKGLPRPRFQWAFKGAAIPGATRSTLVVSNVGAASVGSYSVTLNNGFEVLKSREAALSLVETPQAPVITIPLTNVSVLAGGEVTFVAGASGVPQPRFEWSFKGVVIAGQTGPTLTLSNLTIAAAGEYVVNASNASGSQSSAATLTIRAKPDLRITEVRSTDTLDPDFSRRNGFVPQDWFEVTSFESGSVSLTGWRLDDNSSSLTAAFVLTNAVSIAAGESVIFVERLTPEQFRAWWGTNELPAGLQIFTYSGSGFGLSSGGDGVRFWDATTANNADTVSSVDFPAGTPGVTFNYDVGAGTFGVLSVEGVAGVYQAPGSIDLDLNLTVKDIGSPGRIREGAVVVPPSAPVLSIVLEGGQVLVRFTGQAGYAYRLERRTALGTGDWLVVEQKAGEAGTMTFVPGAPSDAVALYRVVAQ